MHAASIEKHIACSIERHPLIRQVFALASDLGTTVYLVGGTVRDLLLSRDTHDLDFATPGDGLALARSISDRLGGAYVPLDRERRTGRVVLALGEDNSATSSPRTARTRTLYLDVASLRGDDLAADLRGRDLTINAMAIELSPDGAWKLKDVLGGRQDLAAGVLRLASPSSLTEDPVRMLRAVRLQAQFGYTIEPHTRIRLRETAPLLVEVSPERLRDEWFKILQQPDATGAVLELHQLGLLRTIAPPVDDLATDPQRERGQGESFQHALASMRAIERLWAGLQDNGTEQSRIIPDALWALASLIRQRYSARICDERTYLALLKCAALLHNVNTEAAGSAAQVAAHLGRQWRCSNREVDLLQTAVRYHTCAGQLADAPCLNRRIVHRYYRDAGEYGVDAAVLALADSLASGTDVPPPGWTRQAQTLARLLAPFLENQVELLDPTPLLSGGELMHLMHLAPGPQIGQMLARLREEQAAGTIRTRKAAVAWVQERVVSNGGSR